MKRIIIVAFTAMALAVPTAATATHGGPQPLPDAACNEGTENARSHTPTTGAPHERVPHQHTCLGVTGCYHFNPTAPHPPTG